MEFPDKIVQAMKSVLPKASGSIALHEPYFAGNEWCYVKECLDSGWVSYVGNYVTRFEEMIAEYTHVKHAIATVNGTASLHVCLKLMNVEQGDEVLVPTLTFVATANAISYCGAIPHFVDSEENTLGIDPKKLSEYLDEIADVRVNGCYNIKTGRRIKAVIPVHVFGHPVDLDSLSEVCEKFKLEMVEDAAESLGSFYKGIHTGHWGRASILSFNGNKTITTGGGGAILTNDESFAARAKHITTTAKIPHAWEYYHDQVGYNYRMPNINAAVGCAQMEQISDFVSKKRVLAKRYQQAFTGIEGVRFFIEQPFARSNYWLNVLLLEEEYESYRNDLIALAAENKIFLRPLWTLMHKLPMYKDCPRMDLSVAESLERRAVNIPSSAFLIRND